MTLTVARMTLGRRDTFSMEAHSGSTLVSNNASGITQVRWGWGY